MLSELHKAKQIFYRHHYKFPNAIVLTTKALEEYMIDAKDKTVMKRIVPRINGCVVYINDELKYPFEYIFKEELAPND